MEEFEQTSELLKILGDRTRLTIFSLLKIRELCVCELTAILNVSQPAISQHLRKLKLLNVVKERKSGQWVYYSIREPNEKEKMLKSIIENLPDASKLIEILTSEETSCKIQEYKNNPRNIKDFTL